MYNIQTLYLYITLLTGFNPPLHFQSKKVYVISYEHRVIIQVGISAVEIARKVQDRHQTFIIKYADHHALICEKTHLQHADGDSCGGGNVGALLHN